MNRLKELMDARTDKAGELSKLVDLSKERPHTAEERSLFDSLEGELNELDVQIGHEKRLASHLAARSVPAFPGTGEEGNRDISKGDKRDFAGFNLNKALAAKLEQRALDGVEAEVAKMGEERAHAAGLELSGNSIVVLDSVFEQRGQTVTGQTTNPGDQGGVLVEKDLQGLLGLIQADTFLDKVGAYFMTGLKGDIVFPVQETAPTIQELTEIEQMNDSEITFSSFELKPTRRGTTVPISRQTLLQTSFDMQNIVLNAISQALAQKMNAEAIANLLTIITSGNGNLLALGTNGVAPTYNDLVALEGLVDSFNHNRGVPKYLTNTKVRSKLKTTQIFTGTSGAPVWSPDNIVNGYEGVVSNIVPSNLTKGTATNASAIIFGNFNDFRIGMWGGTEFIVDPYTQKRKAQIEITANAFWAMKAVRNKSFAGIKDALTE